MRIPDRIARRILFYRIQSWERLAEKMRTESPIAAYAACITAEELKEDARKRGWL